MVPNVELDWSKEGGEGKPKDGVLEELNPGTLIVGLEKGKLDEINTWVLEAPIVAPVLPNAGHLIVLKAGVLVPPKA